MYRERGFTLFELVAALGLTLILSAIAVSRIGELANPLLSGTAQLSSFLKQTRAKALSTTSAYTVYASSGTTLRARVGTSCTDASPTLDPYLTLVLPQGSQLLSTGWTICFNSRGFANSSLNISVQDDDGQTRMIEIVQGGSVRVL